MTQTASTEPAPRRRRNLLVAGGLAVLLVGGGTVAAVLLLGGSDSRRVDRDALRDPVTEEPQEQWTRKGAVTSAVAVGEVLVVGSDDAGEVVALDEDGEQLWTSDLGGYAYAVPPYSDIVFVTSFGDDRVVALSIDDGEELWSVDGGYVIGSTDEGLVYTDSDEAEVRLLDPATGDEVWAVAGLDSYALTEDAVYVLDDGALSRLAVDSGEEEWSVPVDVGPRAADSASLVANDDLVVVSDAEAVAFDTRDGAELWSQDTGANDEVGIWSAGQAYLALGGASLGGPLTAVTVYDRDGEVGDVEPDPASNSFSALPFELDGNPYVYDSSSGRVLDENLEEVGRYDGQGTVVDGGLYTLQDDGGLSYYEIGASAPEWSIATPWTADVETEAPLVAFDGWLVVVAQDQVVSYR